MNSTSPSASPSFAQSVHQALNRPSGNANTSQPKTLDANASPSPSPQFVPPVATAATRAPIKRFGKAQNSSAPIAGKTFIAALPSQLLSAGNPSTQQLSNVAALRHDPEADESAMSAPGSDAIEQTLLQNSGQSAPECASQIQTSTALPVDANATAFLALMESADSNSRAAEPGPSVDASNADAAAQGSTSESTLNAQLTNAISTAIASTASNSGAQGTSEVFPTNQKTVAAAQVAISSKDLTAGPTLVSMFQRFEDLLSSGGMNRLSPTGAISLTQSEAQSKAAQNTSQSSLLSSATSHISAQVSAGASVAYKSAQNPQIEAHPNSAIPSATSTRNDRPTAGDSSSDSNTDNASDSSGLADSSSPNLQNAKPVAAAFSDAIAANIAPRADAAPVTPVPSPVAPQAVMPPAPADAPPRAADTLPSAPAQAALPTLPTLHSPDTTVGRFVNEAELTNAASQSEMRIAMQTDKLGAIELRAHVNGDELGAAIIVEKRDAHAALAVELPALQQALSEKQLRVEQVALSQGSLHSTAGDAGASAQQGQRGSSGQGTRSNSSWNSNNLGAQQAAWFVPETVAIFDAQGRLSVQA